MKIFKTLSVSLAATICAATIGVGTAYAAEEQPDTTYYPESFLCSLSIDGELTDYAVCGDSYAFAYNGQLAVLTGNGNNQRLPDIKPVSSITQLEYSADGELYVCFADGYCAYPDLTEKFPLSQISVQDKEQWQVNLGEVTYSLNNKDGSLLYMSKSGFSNVKVQDEEGEAVFTKLKKYDNVAYAVTGNSLYKLEADTAVKVEPTYYGFIDMTKTISTGTAAQALKADSPIIYGWIERGKYYTEISLENELGTTFEIPDPATSTALSEDRLYCTVLAQSGNSYIVTMGGKSYLTAKTSVSIETEAAALTPADTEAAYAVENIGIYSRPYLCAATKLCVLESGSANAVTVLGQYTDLNGVEYYKIKYVNSDGTVVSGFTAKRLMTSYAFPAEDSEITTDGGDSQFVYDTNVVTVILAVSIVGLVLIAILYVAVATSAGSKKKKKKKKQQAKKKKTADNKRRDRRYDDDDEDVDEEDDYEDDEE